MKNLKVVIPNFFTFLSSVSALLAIYWAHTTHDKNCFYFVLASGFFDALDGPLARALKVQSRFGNIYDSMSDFLAFGMAPSLCLTILGYLHPLAAAFYILCIQFRLTRYSSMDDDEGPPAKFFQGVSSPDAVYVGTLLSFLLGGNFNWGFLLVGLLAIAPWPIMPKKYKVLKFAIAVGTLLYFILRFQ